MRNVVGGDGYAAYDVTSVKTLFIRVVGGSPLLIQAPGATGASFNDSFTALSLPVIFLSPIDSVVLEFSANQLPYKVYLKADGDSSIFDMWPLSTTALKAS